MLELTIVTSKRAADAAMVQALAKLVEVVDIDQPVHSLALDRIYKMLNE